MLVTTRDVYKRQTYFTQENIETVYVYTLYINHQSVFRRRSHFMDIHLTNILQMLLQVSHCMCIPFIKNQNSTIQFDIHSG